MPVPWRFTVKEQLDLLAKIQEKDVELERLKHQIAEGPKRIAVREHMIEDLEDSLKGDQDRLDAVRKRQRQFEMEVEEGVERIKKRLGVVDKTVGPIFQVNILLYHLR